MGNFFRKSKFTNDSVKLKTNSSSAYNYRTSLKAIKTLRCESISQVLCSQPSAYILTRSSLGRLEDKASGASPDVGREIENAKVEEVEVKQETDEVDEATISKAALDKPKPVVEAVEAQHETNEVDEVKDASISTKLVVEEVEVQHETNEVDEVKEAASLDKPELVVEENISWADTVELEDNNELEGVREATISKAKLDEPKLVVVEEVEVKHETDEVDEATISKAALDKPKLVVEAVEAQHETNEVDEVKDASISTKLVVEEVEVQHETNEVDEVKEATSLDKPELVVEDNISWADKVELEDNNELEGVREATIPKAKLDEPKLVVAEEVEVKHETDEVDEAMISKATLDKPKLVVEVVEVQHETNEADEVKDASISAKLVVEEVEVKHETNEVDEVKEATSLDKPELVVEENISWADKVELEDNNELEGVREATIPKAKLDEPKLVVVEEVEVKHETDEVDEATISKATLDKPKLVVEVVEAQHETNEVDEVKDASISTKLVVEEVEVQHETNEVDEVKEAASLDKPELVVEENISWADTVELEDNNELEGVREATISKAKLDEPKLVVVEEVEVKHETDEVDEATISKAALDKPKLVVEAVEAQHETNEADEVKDASISTKLVVEEVEVQHETNEVDEVKEAASLDKPELVVEENISWADTVELEDNNELEGVREATISKAKLDEPKLVVVEEVEVKHETDEVDEATISKAALDKPKLVVEAVEAQHETNEADEVKDASISTKLVVEEVEVQHETNEVDEVKEAASLDKPELVVEENISWADTVELEDNNELEGVRGATISKAKLDEPKLVVVEEVEVKHETDEVDEAVISKAKLDEPKLVVEVVEAQHETNEADEVKDASISAKLIVEEVEVKHETNEVDEVEEATSLDKPELVVEENISWADIAELEDNKELEGGEHETNKVIEVKKAHIPKLPRKEREYIRFMNVNRKKDLICFERVKGKLVNILQGIELHTGVFSAVEQQRIIKCVCEFEEMGRKGQLQERTYMAPRKWMRGKGRVTMQFGCCYNYATDRDGNRPGILPYATVDPIPPLFKVMIRRLVGWQVIPPNCVPDSCIVNIYDEGDCIPPHIDSHDFVRPFCTVSFLSECNILFGTKLQILGPGDFSGPFAISLPVGSALVLNGNGADVAKHCVPSVPAKRISITFRKMAESKRPIGYVPEPDLQNIQPLPYEVDKENGVRSPKAEPSTRGRNTSRGIERFQGRGGYSYGNSAQRWDRSTNKWRR